MAIYGAVAEGFTSNYGGRPGEFLSRGLATMAGTTLVVSLNLPVRTLKHVQLTIKSTTAPVSFFTAGNYTGNSFTIYSWGMPAQGTPAAAAAITVSSSPFSYTATAAGTVAMALNGATVATLSLTRVAYGPINLTLPTGSLYALYPVSVGDVLINTYSVATPIMEFLPDSVALAALSSTATVEWAAWGTL